MIWRSATICSVIVLALSAVRADAAEGKGNPMVVLSTSMGDIKIELAADKAPVSVQNFLDYVKAGYYDGTTFHRVIPGFVIQGGGLNPDMTDKNEGLKAAIKNESTNGLRNDTGTVAMARTSAPDSATSQFYINLKDNAMLNGTPERPGYTVFGKVVEGMDIVQKIAAAKTTTKGRHADVPADPIIIKSAKVVE